MLKKYLLVISCCVFMLPNLANANKHANQKDTVVRDFTAAGNISENEGWRVVIKRNRMSLELTKNNEFHRKIKVKRSAYAKGVEFTGFTSSGSEVTININGKPCVDSNGNTNEFTAKLYYKGKVMQGCAVRGAFGYAPT